MIRFECKKCGSLVVTEKGSKSATCNICGKTQRIPAVVIEDREPITKNDYDPQRNRYEQLVHKARTYRDIKVLRETADEFYRLGTYEDSLQMAEFCEKRIAEEEAKYAQESDKQKIKDQRNKKGTKQYHIKMAILNAGVVILAIAITLLTNEIAKRPIYNQGQSLMAEGRYNEASYYFGRAGHYKDSEELLKMCQTAILDAQYNKAIADMENGHYIFAMEAFIHLDGYEDSETYILECRYRLGQKYMDEEKYQLAWQEFTDIADYKDAAELADAAKAKLSSSQ